MDQPKADQDQKIQRPKRKFRETLISDEIREAFELLMDFLKELPEGGIISVKETGELCFDPFFRAMKRKYEADEAETKALELWSLWKEYISEPEYHPFKMIEINGKYQQIIDVEDEKLKSLREQVGDEVYETVITAVIEANEYCYDLGNLLPVLWKFSEGQKATLKQGILALQANKTSYVEELKKAQNLATSLAKHLDVKNQTIFELEKKYDKLTTEKDQLQELFSEEMKTMYIQNKKLERELEVQMWKYNFTREENDKLKDKLIYSLQISERQTKEFEKLNSQIKLEVKNKEKETMDLKNDGDCSLTIQIDNLKREISDKTEDYQELEARIQVLTMKHRIANDEVQDARKEAIRLLSHTLNQRTALMIKRMGEVDIKPFLELCLGNSSDGKNPEEMCAELCSSWQDEVENSQWHPFKIVGKNEVIDKDDGKLKKLRDEHGDLVYKAVVDALLEMNEYNSSGRYIVSEIWDRKENRKATLKEIIRYIFKQWQSNKLKRKKI